MLDEYLNMIYSSDKDGVNAGTRRKSDDWTVWAIMIGVAGVAAVLVMGFALYGIMTLV
jgi:hypothetical protein